jgi:glycosyltransferase involved in cell wall biosynthesis
MTRPRPEPRFSIVIPTYSRPLGLGRLLDSLAPQVAGRPGREIVVVNDGSHDPGYAAVVARHGDWVRYIAASDNRGPGTARNRGVLETTGDFLVFIDDDCTAPPDWLDRLARLVTDDPALDAVGGMTRPLPSPNPTRLERMLVAAGAHPNPVFYRGQLIVMVSACLAVRHTMFDTLGGFVEKIMPLAEDRNVTTRLRLAGAKCAIAPEWFVYHDMSSTPKQHFRRYFNYGRGVNNAIALEAVPLDRDYWPPARRPSGYWWSRAYARLKESTPPGKQSGPSTRLPVLLLAAATNLAMDIGYVRAERAKRVARESLKR